MTAFIHCEKFVIIKIYRQGFVVSHHAIMIYSIETISVQNSIVFSKRKYLLATEGESYKSRCMISTIYMSQIPLYFTFKCLKKSIFMLTVI